VQNGLIDKKITQGHLKVLLSIEDNRKLMNIYNQVVENGISVRALESMLNGTKENVSSGNDSAQRAVQPKSSQIKKMEEDLVSKLGTKVEIKHNGGKGKIEISYYSLDDFERIVEKIK